MAYSVLCEHNVLKRTYFVVVIVGVFCFDARVETISRHA